MDSDNDAGSVDSFDMDDGRGGGSSSSSRGREVADLLTSLSQLLADKSKSASTRVTKASAQFESIKRIVGDQTLPA